jgi:hypothetical protein
MVTGASNEDIQQFNAEMSKVFKMSDLGLFLLHYYLGIEV